MTFFRRNSARLIFVALVGLALLFAWQSGLLAQLQDSMSRGAIERWVERAGPWGAIVIIGLMILAVVASPIPSGPIALVAGAAYGQIYGTIYIVIGAETGALIAFGLARTLGRTAIVKWLGPKADKGLLGSQNALTATVFFSRLMPFVSFDLISYAAGLSCLRFWRFALATMAGIIPAAYLLAYFGGEAVDSSINVVSLAVLGLGLITGAPLLIAAFRWQNAKNEDQDS